MNLGVVGNGWIVAFDFARIEGPGLCAITLDLAVIGAMGERESDFAVGVIGGLCNLVGAALISEELKPLGIRRHRELVAQRGHQALLELNVERAVLDLGHIVDLQGAITANAAAVSRAVVARHSDVR